MSDLKASLLALIKRNGAGSTTILNDEAFKNAVNDIEQRYLTFIKDSKIGQSEQRENAYRAIRMLHEIVGQLQTYVSEATYEAAIENQKP